MLEDSEEKNSNFSDYNELKNIFILSSNEKKIFNKKLPKGFSLVKSFDLQNYQTKT